MLAALVTLATGALQAAEEMRGAKDHPAVSRFEGALLVASSEVPFATLRLELGALKFDRTENRLRAAQSESIDGRVAHFLYVAPDATAGLEVRRNYEQALQTDGFRVMYACSQTACGAPHSRVYDIKTGLPRTAWGKVNFRDAAFHHVAARDEAGRVVLVLIGTYVAANDPHTGNAAIYQIVVEPRAATVGQVDVTAAALDNAIATGGKAAIYGLYFDTNSAELKPESQPQLAEIAKFLRTKPELKVLIVGHTDSQGSLEYNLTLSQKRAGAVARALSEQFGVASSRLTAHGAGMIAPVASNRTEAGRAKNRRVELVER